MNTIAAPRTGDGPTEGTFEYRLPSLGADMDVGRVVRWRVEVGDEVHRGDVMAVVETEKSDIDIEIWHDGVVAEFLVPLGEEIPVGTPIAAIGPLAADDRGATEPPGAPVDDERAADAVPPIDERAVDEERAADAVQSVVERAVDEERAVPERAVDEVRAVEEERAVPERAVDEVRAVGAESRPTDRVPASPLARRLARERNIDLASVVGTGPDGAVVQADIEALPVQPPKEPDGTRRKERGADRMRALIAERMSTANREIPQYFLSRDIDVTAMSDWITAENESRPIAQRLLPAALYVKATAVAAARHPELNGFWVDGSFRPGESVDVAMAVSLRGGGLVTPKIAAADERSVDEIMIALRELVSAARSGNLRASWMTGATITLTNLGDTGADLVHGVISPPEVALVGMGAVRRRPWVVGDEVVSRPILTVTLAADHRATDGATGSRFLATVAEALSHPDTL